jgi:hypothetical protein
MWGFLFVGEVDQEFKFFQYIFFKLDFSLVLWIFLLRTLLDISF